MSHPPKNWQRLATLTLTEAAAVLGVSRSRAYEMATAGDLPTHADHIGRQRVRPADLESLLAPTDQPDLFALDDVVAGVAQWLASVADSDGVIRDPDAMAMIREALTDE